MSNVDQLSQRVAVGLDTINRYKADGYQVVKPTVEPKRAEAGK